MSNVHISVAALCTKENEVIKLSKNRVLALGKLKTGQRSGTYKPYVLCHILFHIYHLI